MKHDTFYKISISNILILVRLEGVFKFSVKMLNVLKKPNFIENIP